MFVIDFLSQWLVLLDFVVQFNMSMHLSDIPVRCIVNISPQVNENDFDFAQTLLKIH